MKKKYIYIFLAIFLVSMLCFFIDPHFPIKMHGFKLILWVFLSPGTLLYVGPEFNLNQFITSVVANIIFSAFWVFIYSVFDKRERSNI